MKFEEVTNNKVKIVPPKMKCDRPFDPPPEVEALPCSSHFFGIIAPPGSGKTSLMTNLITRKDMYRKRFHNIWCFTPPNSSASIPGLYNKLDEAKIYDQLDASSIAIVIDRLKEEAKEGRRSLIILDDQMVFLKDKEVAKGLNFITANRRHLGASLWCLSQSFKSISATTRKQMSHIFYFKPRSRMELSAVSEEVLFLDKKQTVELFDFVFDEGDKHAFLLVNMNDGKLYKGFNEIIIVE